MNNYYIGVDLGGTKILTAVADKKGKILARKKLPTEASKGTETIIKNINKTIKFVMEAENLKKSNICRIAVGSPGPLDTSEGIIYENSNLPWKDVPIVRLLEEKTGLPVVLENDANAAALGEKWFGAGKNVSDLIYITVSTGIGGGIIINQKIYHGFNDGAGEIGHITLEPDGPLCGCGNHGCFEALASGTAIARMGKEALKEDQPTLLKELSDNNPEKVDALLIEKAAKKGDQVANNIYKKAGNYLGIGIANLINIINPEMIIMGGGIINAEELFWDKMVETLQERSVDPLGEKVKICKVKLGADTGVQGAIAVAMGDELLSL